MMYKAPTSIYKESFCPSICHTAVLYSSSSSHMRVMNYNWSATKQRLHLQSVAETSRHLVLSGDRIQQCGTLLNLGLATRTQISVCKSPFRSAGTAVSLFHVKMVQ